MALTKTEIDILLKARADLQGFKAARGELGGVQKEIGRGADAFKQFGLSARAALAGIGIGVGVAGTLSSLKSIIDYGSKITDFATQANISTDAFQTLSIAAQDAGLSQEQLANSLFYLRKSIGETLAGTGEAIQSFKDLGLSARYLSRLPLEQALEEVAKATLNAEDKTKAYGQALDILGSRNAPKLQEVLERLAREGFGKINKETEKLRISEENLKTLDDAGDKLARIITYLKVLGAKTVISASDSLSSIVPDVESIKGIEAEIKRLEARIAKNRAAGEATAGSERYLAYYKQQLEAAKQAADRGLDLAEREGALRAKLDLRKIDSANAAKAAAIAEDNAQEARDSTLKQLIEDEKEWGRSAKEREALEKRAADLERDRADFLIDQLPPLDRYVKLQEKRAALVEKLNAPTDDSNEAFEAQLALKKEILDTDKEIFKINQGLSASLDSFFGNIDAASTTMDLFREETKKTKDTAKELGNAFSSAFEGAITRGGKLRDIVRGLLQDILQLFVRQQVSAPIADFFSGAFSNLFGGGKAVGGDVEAGKFYKVGERGVELFAPGMSGTIIPNHTIAAAASDGAVGGDVFNFNYTFTGGVTQNDIARMIPQIVTASKNAVREARRRVEPGFA